MATDKAIEDQVLAGKLTAALAQGIQGDHPFYLKAVATLKHFLGCGSHARRMRLSKFGRTDLTVRSRADAPSPPAARKRGEVSPAD